MSAPVDLNNIKSLTNLSQAEQRESKGEELGKTDFLNLLMAQLANQDPMDPMDNQAFIEQLTSFSNLEQLQGLGTKLDSLLAVTSANNAASTVSLLGRDVRVEGNEFTGPEAKLYYQMPDDVSEAKLVIRNDLGQTVKVIDDIETREGLHSIDIEGLESRKYSFAIEGKDNTGASLDNIPTSSIEYVEGINFSGNIPVILTGTGREVSVIDVLEIKEVKGQNVTAPNPSNGDEGSAADEASQDDLEADDGQGDDAISAPVEEVVGAPQDPLAGHVPGES